MERRKLYISHEHYAEIMDHRASMVRLNPDCTEDAALFEGWLMRRFHLEPFVMYELVVG
jgi:hypothetical protein